MKIFSHDLATLPFLAQTVPKSSTIGRPALRPLSRFTIHDSRLTFPNPCPPVPQGGIRGKNSAFPPSNPGKNVNFYQLLLSFIKIISENKKIKAYPTRHPGATGTSTAADRLLCPSDGAPVKPSPTRTL
jgi:hypothetical protein